MIEIDLSDKSALITGGTRGIGLAAGLHLARAGARVYLTYRWGSTQADEIGRAFVAAGAKPPLCLEADVASDEDTARLLDEISGHESKIDILVSNVCFAQRVKTLADYKKSSFYKSLDYSAWPLIEYTRRINGKFSTYPRYIIAVSSDGAERFYPGYDFVAGSKALLECFARYLAMHLIDQKCQVNVLRFSALPTESFNAIFGEGFFDFLKSRDIPSDRLLCLDDCGRAVVALCSGLLDALNGQVVTIDQGVALSDNALVNYLREEKRSNRSKSRNDGI